jgi:hypothetical protein
LSLRVPRSIIPLALAVAALAGCGSRTSTSTPLDSGLSYFPKDSPFVMSIVTDPNAQAVKGLQQMVHRLPLVTFGEAALIGKLQQAGINYDVDIRPLFGNPLLVGLEGASVTGSVRDKVLFAWITKDASTLSTLITKLRLPRVGTHDGATLYGSPTATFAVDGATVLAGTSQATVNSALDLHAAGRGITSADYNSDLGTLPKNALISAFGNLSGVLSSPSAAKARRVPWVAALRGYGISISAGSGGLTFQYTLDTDGATLSSAQLPIAPGSSPPGLAGTMPIQFGLRQPATFLKFVLDAERRTSPARYAANLAQMTAVSRRTGVDFNRDVLGEIGNNAAVESTGHGFIVRVDVVNPPAAARTLRKLGGAAVQMFGSSSGSRVTPGPTGFETIRSAHGRSLLFGLVGSEFVAGTGSPAQLRAFAAASAAAAPGAQGAAAFRVALPELLRLAMGRTQSKTLGQVQQVLGSLGDVTGWISSSTGALTGSATLALK